MITKEFVYLYALLYRAPIEQPELVKEGIDQAWLDQLIAYSERLILAREKVEVLDTVPYLYPLLVGLHRSSEEVPPLAFSAKELSLDKTAFPTAEPSGKAQESWGNLAAEISQIQTDDLGRYAENVLHLLHKHTAALQCGIADADSISYYDYAKSTAGVAASLLDWWHAEGKSGAFQIDADDEPLLLIGGDLSGIQDYIYQIVSRTAARSLKGRSFYLFLLADNILDALLSELGLFKCNVIYNSGGGFLITGPNTKEVREAIDKFETGLVGKLFTSFGTTLYCALHYATFGNKKTIGETTGEIQEQLRIKKGQKYADYVQGYDMLFEPGKVELGGLQARDVVSGEEMTDEEEKNAWYLDDQGNDDLQRATAEHKAGGSGLIKETTAWQILLGQKLKKVDYWIKASEPIEALADQYRAGIGHIHIQPVGLGIYNYFLSREEWDRLQSKFTKAKITVLQLNDFSTSFNYNAKHWIQGFALYGGNEGPKDNIDNPKTFSEMAGGPEEYKSNWSNYKPQELDFRRLGMLRMDVDGLGDTFLKAVSDKAFSLAAYSTMSRQLDFFFKGYLNTLWAGNELAYEDKKVHLRDGSQIIYAGGDDLFVVGRWDLVMGMAKAINQDFEQWIGHNPALGLSGGMSVVTHKYPAMKAAKLAEDAEKAAKQYQRKGMVKRSFSLMGEPLRWVSTEGWSNEFDIVERLKNQLVKVVQSKRVSRGLLTKIAQHDLSRQLQEREGGNPRWKWIVAYDLSQTQQRLRNSQQYEGEVFIKELQKALQFEQYEDEKLESDYLFIQLLALAARWAELEDRTTRAIEQKYTEPTLA
jgi:CRISPR-associated protein Csm1